MMLRKGRTLVRSLAISCTLSLASFGLAAAPISFSDIYVFGDSLSDTGNTRSQVPLGNLAPIANAAGYGPNGRFSNGPVWHEYLATGLGMPSATFSQGGGNNFAYGGARVDNATGVSAGLLTQNTQYFNRLGGASSDSDALFIAWAGGNDMRDLVGNVDPLAAINARLDTWVGMLGGLLTSGVTTLLVPNLPDLGNIPEFRTGANAASGTAVTAAWNQGLEDRLRELNETTDASIYYFDVFGIFNELLDDPASFGFTNTTDECRSVVPSGFLGLSSTEVACAGADTYAFWDQIHPTTTAHAYLGMQAYELLMSGNALAKVPEPMALILLLIGLLALWGRRTWPAGGFRLA